MILSRRWSDQHSIRAIVLGCGLTVLAGRGVQATPLDEISGGPSFFSQLLKLAVSLPDDVDQQKRLAQRVLEIASDSRSDSRFLPELTFSNLLTEVYRTLDSRQSEFEANQPEGLIAREKVSDTGNRGGNIILSKATMLGRTEEKKPFVILSLEAEHFPAGADSALPWFARNTLTLVKGPSWQSGYPLVQTGDLLIQDAEVFRLDSAGNRFAIGVRAQRPALHEDVRKIHGDSSVPEERKVDYLAVITELQKSTKQVFETSVRPNGELRTKRLDGAAHRNIKPGGDEVDLESISRQFDRQRRDPQRRDPQRSKRTRPYPHLHVVK